MRTTITRWFKWYWHSSTASGLLRICGPWIGRPPHRRVGCPACPKHRWRPVPRIALVLLQWYNYRTAFAQFLRRHLFSVHSREYITPPDDHRLILYVFYSSYNVLRVYQPEMAYLRFQSVFLLFLHYK